MLGVVLLFSLLFTANNTHTLLTPHTHFRVTVLNFIVQILKNQACTHKLLFNFFINCQSTMFWSYLLHNLHFDSFKLIRASNVLIDNKMGKILERTQRPRLLQATPPDRYRGHASFNESDGTEASPPSLLGLTDTEATPSSLMGLSHRSHASFISAQSFYFTFFFLFNCCHFSDFAFSDLWSQEKRKDK